MLLSVWFLIYGSETTSMIVLLFTHDTIILLRLVKLGSPHVSIMIVAGAIMFYTIVILFGVDENVASHTTVEGLCQTRVWVVSVGFSLLYGTILAKTWRVYYIFSYTTASSKLVRV